jgi:hypothetical protein
MGKRTILGVTILWALAATGPAAFGQDQTQNAPQAPVQAHATSKPKVWTNDNIDSALSPADVYMANQLKEQEAQKAAEKQKPQASQPASAAPKTPSAPPALSNPKTMQSADDMIAWEQRDIDSQQEFVDKLQQQLDNAPESDQQHIRDRIQERTRAIESTRKEMQTLQAEKAALEKKAAAAAAAGGNSASGGSGSSQN